MKRYRFLLLCLLLLLTLLVACTPTDPPAEVPDTQVSLDRLCEGMGLSEGEADALLKLLEGLGVTGEVLFAYPAEDEAERIYYHVWIGEGTVELYLADTGEVTAVRRAGALLYGELPPAPDEGGDEAGDEPELPYSTSITIESYTATVVPGGTGYVRAQAFAGVEYQIKVYYASGVSTAKALSPKVAGEDGMLTWEWTVSAQVKPGVYKIIVVRADDKRDAVTLPFEVLEDKT